ncbi:TspO/MBR family protein [Mangrovimonas xylaniphaga]|uniref:TspO/MBR family protein n=1 Tax=Mangrovimonas xylaniphaga TaxID=1645915 RepID=UPI0006B4543F|nr:TspO/MBR family protein [Mangrovimonas xylaniphaga]
MKLFKLILVFLIINFGALALGTLFMDNGPHSDWYLNLNKAPWTPPGWAFGAAWFTIMICFSIYMAYLVRDLGSKYIWTLFTVQFILNVSWNYVFFKQHLVLPALFIIILLTLVVIYFFFKYRIENVREMRLLLLPYIVWLVVASSLNAYIFLYN